MGIGMKEEYTALESKRRLAMAFFVDDLPPTPTDPAGYRQRRLSRSATAHQRRRTWRRVTRRIKGRSLPLPKIKVVNISDIPRAQISVACCPLPAG